MKKLIFAAGLVAASAGLYAQPQAPLDLQVALSGAAIDSLNGASTNAEFDGVAVIPNESAFYVMDSIGTMDGIFTPTGPAVFASEAQLSPNTNVSAGDLDANATSLFVSMFDSTAAKQTIWRIPHTGFAGAVNMVDSSGTQTVQMKEIEVDTDNSRLIISYNDAFGAVTENIVHVPLTASAATATQLVSEADIEAVLATMTGYTDDTTDDVNVHDMTVQPDGDVIISHGFSSNRQINGSLLRITETGTVSVFRTADQIIASAGALPSSVDIGSVNVESLSDGMILIQVNFTSASGILSPFIAVLSADGTTQYALATEAELMNDASVTPTLMPAGQFLFRLDGKGGDVAADDDYYFYRQSVSGTGLAEQNAVLRLTGVRARINVITASAAANWSLFE